MKKRAKRLIQKVLNTLHINVKDYPKVTFRLSVIGFIGSIGFYIGVLRDLNQEPADPKGEIEILKKENERLENYIDLLTENRK